MTHLLRRSLPIPTATRRITSFLATHQYHNFAITRHVPDSFVHSLSKYYDSSDIDNAISIPLARSHHKDYVTALRSEVPTLELPAVENHPDSVFVEDTVVAVQNRAVITFPGHVSRQGEVEAIRTVLKQLGMDVWDMKSKDEDAVCDGGDVLYTGRHMWVGLTDRTNEKSAEVLAEAFSSQFPVLPVPLNTNDALHLKSIITHLDENTLLAPTGPVGDAVVRDMKVGALGYSVIRLPDIRACNVVAINGTIVASSSICEESQQLLRQAVEERNLRLRFVGTSEIAKSDGACTCCSILLAV